MWPYKPISWDRYYANNVHDSESSPSPSIYPCCSEQSSVTSGLAAGITIGVFFTVFILTFICRLFGRRTASLHDAEIRPARLRRRLSVTDLFMCSNLNSASQPPPPPYEVAIRMPKPGPPDCAAEQPPPFSEQADIYFTAPTSLSAPTSPSCHNNADPTRSYSSPISPSFSHSPPLIGEGEPAPPYPYSAYSQSLPSLVDTGLLHGRIEERQLPPAYPTAAREVV